MAMTYQNFASLGVNLNRQKYGPLDISNVFTSAADLKYYLTKGTFTEGVSEYWYKDKDNKVVPYPYEGQVLATVIDGVVSVYALALDADGNFTTQEIGAKIETDDKTIKLVDGKLELVGLPEVTTGKTFVPSLVNGVLTWAEPDTSTAEGQQQAIDGLTTRMEAVEETINGKPESAEGAGDAVVGLVEKVAALEAVDNATQAELDAYKEVVTAAIAAGVKEAKDYADEQDSDTVYDDTDVKARIKAIEDADFATAIATEKTRAEAAEKALDDAIKAIDFIDADELADVIKDFTTKTYVDGEIDKIEQAIAGLNHFTTKIVTSVDEVTEIGILYLIKDETATGSDKYNEYLFIDGVAVLIGDTTTDLGNYYNKTEIDETVETLNTAISDEAEAREALAEEVAALKAVDNATQEELDAYKLVVTADIDTAKTAAIAAAKTETEGQVAALQSSVAATYATQTALSEAIQGIENDLLSYTTNDKLAEELAKKADTTSVYIKTEVDSKIGTPGTPAIKDAEGNVVTDAVAGTGVYQHVYSKDEVTALIADITGGESAADVLAALNAYKTTNDTRVKAVEDVNTEQATAIATAQAQADKGVTDAAKVAGDLVTANLAIAENTREIGVVDNKIDTVNETLSGKISALETKDASFTSALASLEATVGGHTATIAEQGTKISALETRDVELAALIQANTEKFANYYTTTQVDSKVQEAIDAIPEVDFTPYLKSEDAATTYATIAALTEEVDRAKAAEQKIADDLALLIENPTEALDSVKELIEHVTEHGTDIAGVITRLDGHDSAISALQTAVESIVEPKASEEVTVSEDGTLGLGKVSTDKLEMGVDTLVIDGGSAI